MAEFKRIIRNKDLKSLALPFGKVGQIGTRKLTEDPATPDWVAHVIFPVRVGTTDQVDFTTLIVKDKTFDQSYKAKNWMVERMGEIFALASVSTT